jgi:hypothetical protein
VAEGPGGVETKPGAGRGRMRRSWEGGGSAVLTILLIGVVGNSKEGYE